VLPLTDDWWSCSLTDGSEVVLLLSTVVGGVATLD
jgi:hypothetical protein